MTDHPLMGAYMEGMSIIDENISRLRKIQATLDDRNMGRWDFLTSTVEELIEVYKVLADYVPVRSFRDDITKLEKQVKLGNRSHVYSLLVMLLEDISMCHLDAIKKEAHIAKGEDEWKRQKSKK